MIRVKTHAVSSVRGWRLSTAALLLGTCLATPVLAEETSSAKPAAPAATETMAAPATPVAAAFDFKVEVSSIDVTDGNVTGPELRELFGPDAGGKLDLLTTITAKRIYIPSITIVSTVPTEDGGRMSYTITMSDVEFTDIADGIAANAVIGKTILSGIPDFGFTYGKMAATNFDVTAMLGVYGLVTPEADGEEPNLVYGSFTAEGGAITSPVVNCTIGGLESGSFYARPLSVTIADLSKAIEGIETADKAGGKPSPESIKTIITYYAELLTAFTSEPSTFKGFECSGTEPETNTPFTASAGEFTMAGYEPGIYPALAFNDIKVDFGTFGTFSLGNFTWKQMDLNGTIEALTSADTIDEEWFATNWRKLIPAIEGLALSGLDMDVIDPEKPGDRVKLKVADFDVTLGDYVNGVPSNVEVSGDNIVTPVPANDPSMAVLTQAGITEVDLSFGTAFHWDKESSTIVVEQIGFDIPGLSRINISGTLGNATADLFADNPDQAMMASLGLTLKDLHITLEDKGMAPIVIAAGAAEAGQPEGTFKTMIAGQMQGMLLAILGSSESSMAAATAIGDFIQGKKQIDLTLTAVDPAGVSLAELSAASENPTVLAGKFTIAGEAK